MDYNTLSVIQNHTFPDTPRKSGNFSEQRRHLPEDFIGLANLLEPFLGLRLFVLVRVKLQSHFPDPKDCLLQLVSNIKSTVK